MLSNNQEAFLALVRAGLWEKKVDFPLNEDIDYAGIKRLSEEQTVQGVVAAGLENLTGVSVPKDIILSFVGSALQLEQRNIAMNDFIGKLIAKMRTADIYALLVKGQGIAQCYERPLWRESGDVDLLLSEMGYDQAVCFLSPFASNVEGSDSFRKHIAMIIDSWTVELHGTLRCGLWRKLDTTIDNCQKAAFSEGGVRTWANGNTQVLLPRADEDVVFVFSHILQHFFSEGIGLRQICDWCRLLWTFRDKIDTKLLESRVRSMGVMTEWKTFAALAVEYLGMPKKVIPFYSPSNRWKRNAKRLMTIILKVGNFGNNRDRSYVTRCSYASRKIISLWRHTCDGIINFFIFPLDSLKVWLSMVSTGVEFVVKGK